MKGRCTMCFPGGMRGGAYSWMMRTVLFSLRRFVSCQTVLKSTYAPMCLFFGSKDFIDRIKPAYPGKMANKEVAEKIRPAGRMTQRLL